ncbi:MAG: AraC family transcriptional regulator [Firmicutes bacterium HGW-Firmicutes-21]|nr:MAG: AraC family transcriptional regulator [Firmicutes bacterium HGW-Firmicutes-21]
MYEWNEAIQKMIDWIEDNITENPSLLDMSKQIGYSPFYCSTRFHEIVGMTLKSYMAGRRLCRATLEIRDTKERILDIAIKNGYSSQVALTRAFTSAYGCTPYMYRKNPCPLPLFNKKEVVFPCEYHQKGERIMNEITTSRFRIEYIPAHKYIGIYDNNATGYGEMWAGHDCDKVTGIVESMNHLCHPVVTAHTAGWIWRNGIRSYFYGLGVPLDYSGEIPEGFEIREIPESYYLVFYHPPFDYLRDNDTVMSKVESLAWNFDPSTKGYKWNEEACQDYQRHYPEGLGYQVLRPIVKA